jgi:predicted cupin superfamily sugar epimerase
VTQPLSADEIIRVLSLQPHPEGGHYCETFRDEPGPDGRARSTAIYFLLKAGERSHWHRIDAVEVWHFYAGAPLTLHIAEEGKPPETIRMGIDIANDESPQAIVPAGVWQAAESLGDWTLVGCTVAPGFRFEGFELASDPVIGSAIPSDHKV